MTEAVAPTPRIAPVSPPYPEAVAAALDRIMPPGVPPLSLFRTMAVNERVFLRLMSGGLLDRGTLTLRERELVIDRTTARCGSEYEWGVHVAFFGERVRLTPEEIAATCAAEPPPGVFSARERLLLRLVDTLHDTSTVADGLWRELAREFTPPQLVELVALAGFYHMISFLTNALALAPEPFAPRFPGAGAA